MKDTLHISKFVRDNGRNTKLWRDKELGDLMKKYGTASVVKALYELHGVTVAQEWAEIAGSMKGELKDVSFHWRRMNP